MATIGFLNVANLETLNKTWRFASIMLCVYLQACSFSRGEESQRPVDGGDAKRPSTLTELCASHLEVPRDEIASLVDALIEARRQQIFGRNLLRQDNIQFAWKTIQRIQHQQVLLKDQRPGTEEQRATQKLLDRDLRQLHNIRIMRTSSRKIFPA
jgi:hypothetical protein